MTRFPYEIARLAQDLAGGAVVTLPSEQDLRHPEVGPLLDKYLRGRADVPTEHRIRALRLIENLTLGRNAVGYLTESLHGAGSPQAQRVVIQRQVDLEARRAMARRLAGIPPEGRAAEPVRDRPARSFSNPTSRLALRVPQRPVEGVGVARGWPRSAAGSSAPRRRRAQSSAAAIRARPTPCRRAPGATTRPSTKADGGSMSRRREHTCTQPSRDPSSPSAPKTAWPGSASTAARRVAMAAGSAG